jgi:hypothetical protein
LKATNLEKHLPGIVALGVLLAEHEELEYVENHQIQRLSKELFSETPKLFCLVAEHDEQIVGILPI